MTTLAVLFVDELPRFFFGWMEIEEQEKIYNKESEPIGRLGSLGKRHVPQGIGIKTYSLRKITMMHWKEYEAMMEKRLYDMLTPEQQREYDNEKKVKERKRKLEKLNHPIRYFFKSFWKWLY
jgi:hypothetical protein